MKKNSGEHLFSGLNPTQLLASPLMEQSTNPWLTVAGAARYLGFSASTIIRWSDAGELPHIRTKSGYRRFNKSDLDTWKDNHTYVPGGKAKVTESRTSGVG